MNKNIFHPSDNPMDEDSRGWMYDYVSNSLKPKPVKKMVASRPYPENKKIVTNLQTSEERQGLEISKEMMVPFEH